MLIFIMLILINGAFFKRGNEKFMFDEKSKKFILQKYKVLNFEL